MSDAAQRRHSLKIWPSFFDDVAAGLKTFEVRKNDRDFRAGDVLCLFEYSNVEKRYTGRYLHKLVMYVLDGGAFGIEDGYCVMALGEAPSLSTSVGSPELEPPIISPKDTP